MNKNSKLLEQYIKETVDESLKNAFVDPFVDIVKTATYGVKDLSLRTRTLFKTIINGLPSLFVPLLNIDYKSFRADEKENLAKLKEKYKDVLARNDEAFFESDLMGVAFLLNPQAMLGAKLAKATPKVALGLLDTFTGGTSKTVETLQNWYNRLTGPHPDANPENYHGAGDRWSAGGSGGGGGGGALGYDFGVDYGSYGGGDSGGMYEAVIQQPPQSATQAPQTPAQNPDLIVKQRINQLLKDPNFLNQISNSNIIKNLRNDAMGIIVDRVAKFMKINSLEEFQTKFGSGAQKMIKTISDKEKASGAQEQDEQKLNQAILATLKKEYKQFYIGKVQELSKIDQSLGPVISATISKINSLN